MQTTDSIDQPTTMYAFVVLYNMAVNGSKTCEALEHIVGHDIRVLVIDNSTRDLGNEAVCGGLGWHYLSMHGNAGLSKAYNIGLDLLKSRGDEGIVILLDDDSNVTQEYFDELEADLRDHPDVDIFCPPIRAQDGKFYSPNSYGLIKSHQMHQATDMVPQKHFNAINSCTAIRSYVFDGYRYDERLFLDQIDHKFFEDQRNLGRKFMKMSTIINHEFSLQEVKDIQSIERRYSILVPDFLTFSSRNWFRMLLGYLKVFGWAVREYRHTGNCSIFGWFRQTTKDWRAHGQRLD